MINPAPFTMPIYLLGSLQWFADVREARANQSSNSIAVSTSQQGAPAGQAALQPPPAGVPLIQGEG